MKTKGKYLILFKLLTLVLVLSLLSAHVSASQFQMIDGKYSSGKYSISCEYGTGWSKCSSKEEPKCDPSNNIIEDAVFRLSVSSLTNSSIVNDDLPLVGTVGYKKLFTGGWGIHEVANNFHKKNPGVAVPHNVERNTSHTITSLTNPANLTISSFDKPGFHPYEDLIRSNYPDGFIDMSKFIYNSPSGRVFTPGELKEISDLDMSSSGKSSGMGLATFLIYELCEII